MKGEWQAIYRSFSKFQSLLHKKELEIFPISTLYKYIEIFWVPQSIRSGRGLNFSKTHSIYIKKSISFIKMFYRVNPAGYVLRERGLNFPKLRSIYTGERHGIFPNPILEFCLVHRKRARNFFKSYIQYIEGKWQAINRNLPSFTRCIQKKRFSFFLFLQPIFGGRTLQVHQGIYRGRDLYFFKSHKERGEKVRIFPSPITWDISPNVTSSGGGYFSNFYFTPGGKYRNYFKSHTSLLSHRGGNGTRKIWN